MQWPLPIYGSKYALLNRNAVSALNAVNVTASATPHTKGAWTQITASTGGTAAYGIMVWLNTTATAATDTSTLMDVGVGGAGSEAVVVSNIMVGFRPVGRQMDFIPIYIPANTRVAVRIQSAVVSKVVTISMDIMAGEPASAVSAPSKFTTYGVSTVTSGGTATTPNASANVMGAYAELSAATTAPIHRALVNIQCNSATQVLGNNYMVEIAQGGAGSERTILAGYVFYTSTNENWEPLLPMMLPIELNVPAGVRLSARISANGASGDAMQVSVIGVTY